VGTALAQVNFGTLEPWREFGGFEPFVDEVVVGRFLQLEPRRVLEMARDNELPAHPIGKIRKTWRFLISEIAAHFGSQNRNAGAKMPAAVPGTKERNRLG
jgi:hypothetical protein